MTNRPVVSNVQLRPISPNDAPAVAELSNQLGYEASPAEMADRIAELLRAPDQAAFVASINATVVGWIEVSISRHLHTAPYGIIGGLVVSEAVRSRGIGKLLCDEAERWAKGRGMEILRVRSNAKRSDAHRFYLREGFQQTKTSAVFEKGLADL